MKPLEGYTVVEQTDDKIVQEERFGERGVVRITGNPNPPPEEHQKTVDKAADILRIGERRKLSREQIGA